MATISVLAFVGAICLFGWLLIAHFFVVFGLVILGVFAAVVHSVKTEMYPDENKDYKDLTLL